VTITSLGDNEFGLANSEVEIQLSCQLSCPPTAPTLHYATGLGDYLFSQTMERFDGLSYGLLSGVDPTGTSLQAKDGLPHGASYLARVTGANCYCGNRAVESGFIDLESNLIQIPPYINPLLEPYVAGSPDSILIVMAAPRGSESVSVTITGAGTSESYEYSVTDFAGSTVEGSVVIFPKPSQSGTLTVVATLNPYQVSASRQVLVVSDPNQSGGADGGATDNPNLPDPDSPGCGGCGSSGQSGSSLLGLGLGLAFFSLKLLARRRRGKQAQAEQA